MYATTFQQINPLSYSRHRISQINTILYHTLTSTHNHLHHTHFFSNPTTPSCRSSSSSVTPLIYSPHCSLHNQTLLDYQRPGHNPVRIRGKGPAPIRNPTISAKHRSPLVREKQRIKRLNEWNHRYRDLKEEISNQYPVVYDAELDNHSNHNVLQQQVIDLYGNIYGTILLNSNVWSSSYRSDIIHQIVVWQQARSRSGTANTLTRAQVTGSGRKLTPQKGLGRARRGDRYSPIFVGGGNAHGPHRLQTGEGSTIPRFDFKLNKKVRRLGMRIVLSQKLRENKVYIIQSPHLITPSTPASHSTSNTFITSHRTQHLNDLLQDRQWLIPHTQHRRILICYSRTELENQAINNLALASRNLDSIDLIEQVGLNVLSILRHDLLLLTTQALQELEMRLDENMRREPYEYTLFRSREEDDSGSGNQEDDTMKSRTVVLVEEEKSAAAPSSINV